MMFQKLIETISFQSCVRVRKYDSKVPVTLAGSTVFIPIKLLDKKPLTADTRRFRFALPAPDQSLGIPIGNFIQLTVAVDGQQETRSYTPISTNEDRGFVEFAIKIYFPTAQNPRGGVVSQFLDTLKRGDEVLMSGPLGLLTYGGCGTFLISPSRYAPGIPKTCKAVGMIAGGSGVTAMIPILRTMLKETGHQPVCSLVYANCTDQDIIMRDELQSLESKNRKRLKIWYTVDKPSKSNWKYGVGRICETMLQERLPAPDDDVLILVCGPRPMVAACRSVLLSVRYTPEMIFIFSNP